MGPKTLFSLIIKALYYMSSLAMGSPSLEPWDSRGFKVAMAAEILRPGAAWTKDPDQVQT